MLVQTAISRTREYAADRGGAQLSGDPLGLVSALDKLDNAARQIETPPAQQNLATAPLFIVNPLSGVRMDNLFSTYPSTANRIAALEERASGLTGVISAPPTLSMGSLSAVRCVSARHIASSRNTPYPAPVTAFAHRMCSPPLDPPPSSDPTGFRDRSASRERALLCPCSRWGCH